MVCAYTRPRYQVIVYRTIGGPLIFLVLTSLDNSPIRRYSQSHVCWEMYWIQEHTVKKHNAAKT